MSSRIVIGSRSSALARLQAYHVSASLQRKNKNLEVEYYFKEAQGDKDLETPLWQMGDRGVFTRDLTQDLLSKKVDAVVHSYKDLETKPNSKTQVLSVLPRADARDLLLIKKNKIKNLFNSNLKIYSSSPRRKYNLERFLKHALPIQSKPNTIEFESIRGNIQTRLNKFMELDGQGFVIAKAALDRILSEDFEEAKEEDYKNIRKQIGHILKQCQLMVIPLSRNPCAPAQGSFALEIRSDDHQILEMALDLNHKVTEASVQIERKILSKYGGGCHQKIGAAHIILADKNVTFVQGLTDDGKKLDQVIIQNQENKQEIPVSKWPPENWDIPSLISMHWTMCKDNTDLCHFDQDEDSTEEKILCTKTVAHWFELAKKDQWVHATADGLGWIHAPDLTLYTQ